MGNSYNLIELVTFDVNFSGINQNFLFRVGIL